MLAGLYFLSPRKYVKMIAVNIAANRAVRSSSEDDLNDLHPDKAVAEADHQLVERSDVFIDIPIAAHIAPGCNGRKMIAPSAQFRLVLQREEGAHIRDPGFLEPGFPHHFCPACITDIKSQNTAREFRRHGIKQYFHIFCADGSLDSLVPRSTSHTDAGQLPGLRTTLQEIPSFFAFH